MPLLMFPTVNDLPAAGLVSTAVPLLPPLALVRLNSSVLFFARRSELRRAACRPSSPALRFTL